MKCISQFKIATLYKCTLVSRKSSYNWKHAIFALKYLAKQKRIFDMERFNTHSHTLACIIVNTWKNSGYMKKVEMTGQNLTQWFYLG